MTQYITIKEAADLSGKSIQTIRRMVKSKKVKYRKDRTPQGFNYLIDNQSLAEVCNLTTTEVLTQKPPKAKEEIATPKVKIKDLDLDHDFAETTKPEPAKPPMDALKPVLTNHERMHQHIVNYEPVKEFTDTMQKLIEQHGREKENLFKLVETFQNKVISLENKLKTDAVGQKSWFKFW